MRRPPDLGRLRRGVGALVLSATLGAPSAGWSQAPAYDVYAVRYAVLPAFPVAGLIAGADTSRWMDIAMMMWLLTDGAGRKVLVDAGFYRPRFVERWRPKNYLRPPEALAAAGAHPEAITDIIITHVH